MKLLILADVHANWAALRAVADAESDADAVVSLGDLVINGPQPSECVRWAMERATWSIRGNHDEKLLAAADGELVTHGSRARVLAGQQARQVTPEELAYLRDLPIVERFDFGGATFCAVHGSMTDGTTGSLRDTTSPLLIRAELDQARADYLLVGHTHWPLRRDYRGRTLLNPGAVGQPRDGDPRAQYAIWQDGEFQFRRATWPIEETVRAMQASGCPPEYLPDLIQGWRTGRNPSALPDRQIRGQYT